MFNIWTDLLAAIRSTLEIHVSFRVGIHNMGGRGLGRS